MDRSARRVAAAGFSSRFLIVIVLTGLGAGIAGTLITLLLHLVQHLAFGYTEDTFLFGVEQASATRRVLAMAIGGLIVGLGWWALRRRREIWTVTAALQAKDPRLPIPTTTADSILQIVAVGFGASLGREGAPRQLGAAVGVWLAHRAGLAVAQQKTVLACGAGAGLAAVYNVPLGGAIFVLEILLASTALADVLAAGLACALATAVSWPVLSNHPTYQVPSMHSSGALLVFAVLLGPLAGVVGALFVRITSVAQVHTPRGWRLPVVTTTVFAAVGVAAVSFPQLLGNGKGPAQLAFDGTSTLLLFAVLVVLKPLATAACLASGATGGLLTPSLATGALLGAATGGLLSEVWPGTSLAAFAILGAAAVLANTQRAPLTAVVLVIEFTHTGDTLLVSILMAVVGSVLTGRYISSKSGWEKDSAGE